MLNIFQTNRAKYTSPTSVGGLKVASSRSLLYIKKYSPEILLGVGLASGAGALVASFMSSEAVHFQYDYFKHDLADWKKMNSESEEYKKLPELQRKQHKVSIYGFWLKRTVKHLLPTIGLATLSAACFIGQYKILSNRNAVLTASLGALELGYAAYRRVVARDQGEEYEEQAYNTSQKLAFQPEKLTEEEREKYYKRVETEDGAICQPIPRSNYSPYARWFDELSTEFTDDAQANLSYILGVQDYYNTRLKAGMPVFLNEIYRSLGLPLSSAGSVVGWLRDYGDKEIDFGIFDANEQTQYKKDFVAGIRKDILLDFNVAGTIYDKL